MSIDERILHVSNQFEGLLGYFWHWTGHLAEDFIVGAREDGEDHGMD